MKFSDVVALAEIEEVEALEYAESFIDEPVDNPHRDAIAILVDRGDRAIHRLATLEREECTCTSCLPARRRRTRLEMDR